MQKRATHTIKPKPGGQWPVLSLVALPSTSEHPVCSSQLSWLRAPESWGRILHELNSILIWDWTQGFPHGGAMHYLLDKWHKPEVFT